jgi:DNA-binding XRE family transcriptional regulator
MKLRVKCAPGDKVREAREQRLLTQQEAAAQIGVAPRTLQNWEAGTVTPRAKHQRAILAWLEETA